MVRLAIKGCQGNRERRRVGSARSSAAGSATAGADDLAGALARHGYEPRRDDAGTIRLRNCPFHQLAEQHREIVCGMNLGLIEGLIEGLRVQEARPALDPSPGHCCVAIGGDRP
jgi:predicted ArsR family transcriptional regulator